MNNHDQSSRQAQQSAWYQWLSENQQLIVDQAHQMIEHDRTPQTQYHDYSYLVFPMAKVYEGFIKRYLFKIGLIDQKTFNSKRFRIGRSINPDIRDSQRDEHWLYDDLAQNCGEEVSRELWDTWLECRNQVFHYFPSNPTILEFPQAVASITRLERAMQLAVSCQLEPELG